MREQLRNDFGRESCRGFIEHQDLRRDEQGPTDREHLPLTAGEPPRGQQTLARQVGEQRVDLCDLRRALRSRQSLGADQQIVMHGQRREHILGLGHEAQARRKHCVRRQRGDVLARKLYPTRAHGYEARHRFDERGLAGAIRAQHRDDLAARSLQ